MVELSDRLEGIGVALACVAVSPLYIANGAWRWIITRSYEEFRDYVNDGWQTFNYACEEVFRGRSLENE